MWSSHAFSNWAGGFEIKYVLGKHTGIAQVRLGFGICEKDRRAVIRLVRCRFSIVLPGEDHVGRAALGDFRRHLVGEFEAAQVIPESTTSAKDDRCDRDVQVVNQSGA